MILLMKYKQLLKSFSATDLLPLIILSIFYPTTNSKYLSCAMLSIFIGVTSIAIIYVLNFKVKIQTNGKQKHCGNVFYWPVYECILICLNEWIDRIPLDMILTNEISKPNL